MDKAVVPGKSPKTEKKCLSYRRIYRNLLWGPVNLAS